MIEGASGSIESTNEGATLENLEFPGGVAATVWFSWTALEDGWVGFQAIGNNPRLLVFSGTRIAELRLLSQPDFRSLAHVPVKRGETYRIAVAVTSANRSGTRFTLNWASHPVGSMLNTVNDQFENAIEIDGLDEHEVQLFPQHFRIFQYSVQPGEPVATGVGTSWWSWTAPSDGRFTWRMDGSTAYQLTFLSGNALDNLMFVDSLRGGSTVVLDATAETQYWIALGRSPQSIGGGGRRPDTLTWGPTPANDERLAASRIVGAAGSSQALLRHATMAPNEPRDTVGTDSVWWRWRAPTSGWQRFWIEGHPLATVLAAYSGSNSMQAIADSERTIIANGRVELYVLARAGQEFDIRLSSRPGVTSEAPSTTLRWEASEAPAYLAYKGAVTVDTLSANPLAQGFRAPHNLAISDDGYYLFSTSDRGVFAFSRDSETGEIAPVHHEPTGLDSDAPTRNMLKRARLWWNSRDDRLIALMAGASYSYELPEDGLDLLTRSDVSVDGGVRLFDPFANPGVGSSDGQYFYAGNESAERLQVFRVDLPTRLTHVQTVSSRSGSDDDALIVQGIGRALGMTLSTDGLYLYVVTENGLFVFSRDASSGRLELVREIHRTSTTDNPFHDMYLMKSLSLDGTGAILFVSGVNVSNAFLTTIAAFDIAKDPSDPSYLDSQTGPYARVDGGCVSSAEPPAFNSSYDDWLPRPCTPPRSSCHGRLLPMGILCRRMESGDERP